MDDRTPGDVTDPEGVTRLLESVRAGNREAFDRLFALIYPELHEIAARQRGRWQGDETLNTTALLHEAYLRLADRSTPPWQNRAHFLAVASQAMRHILLDYAKRQRAAKRGGGGGRVSFQEVEATLTEAGDPTQAGSEALIALDESLRRLERLDPRQGRIVECRFFGGMTIRDTAEALDLSPATVKRAWAMAQAWLYRDLTGSPEESP